MFPSFIEPATDDAPSNLAIENRHAYGMVVKAVTESGMGKGTKTSHAEPGWYFTVGGEGTLQRAGHGRAYCTFDKTARMDKAVSLEHRYWLTMVQIVHRAIQVREENAEPTFRWPKMQAYGAMHRERH